jgi:hypothetical protein
MAKQSRATQAPDEKVDAPLPAGRQHRATYSRDKKKGGYIVRVEGPNATAFTGRTVPVTTRDGTEHEEKLLALVWSGADKTSGKPVALYTFEQKPRGAEEAVF